MVRVRISQNRFTLLWKSLLWAAAWAVPAYACLRFSSGALSVVGFIGSCLLCVIGLVFANGSVNRNDLWLTPNSLRLRTAGLITRRTRTFPLSAVRGFGFGQFSHNGPVLKFEVGGTWFVLAQDVYERDVDDLLQRVAQCGFSVPR